LWLCSKKVSLSYSKWIFRFIFQKINGNLKKDSWLFLKLLLSFFFWKHRGNQLTNEPSNQFFVIPQKPNYWPSFISYLIKQLNLIWIHLSLCKSNHHIKSCFFFLWGNVEVGNIKRRFICFHSIFNCSGQKHII